MQVTVDGSHEFSDAFKVHLLAGWTESHHRNPIQATLMADYGCYSTTYNCNGTTGGVANSIGYGAGTNADPYIYDYSNGDMPLISTGNVDPTSTTDWFLSNVRMREQYAYNSYRGIQGDFEYSPIREIKLSGGFSVRNYGFNTLELRRSNGVAGSTGADDSPRAVQRSVPLSSIVGSISMRGIDVPDGSDTSWFTIDFNKAAGPLSLWDSTVNPVTSEPGYSNTGKVRENEYGGWLQAAWDSELFGMGFRGDIGARYVLTEMNSLGYSALTISGATVVVPITAHTVYHDWLPTLNAVLEPVDSFLIRFNAGYAMSRPGLQAMMPTASVAVSGANAGVTLGNPALQPTRSKNLDLSFEWYYSEGSMLSVAGFWKHIDTFIQSQQTTGIWSENPFGIDEAAFVGACGGTGTDWTTVTNTTCTPNRANTIWTYTKNVNSKGAPLWGTEINWQQQFRFLPAPFDSFGVAANFTYVQAQQSYYGSDGHTLIMTEDLTNLSRISYNGTVYYDDNVFQARITGAFRSHYLISSNIASNNNNYGIYSQSTFNLDASASYKYTDNVMFTFDALNLTNQASNIIADKFAQRSYQYHETGRVFFAGVRYTY